MRSNKSIRELMIKKYGEKCMMEEAGIRYIPAEKRRRITGYKKIEEQITYHHLTRKSKGGKTTEENGALLKWYNHAWLEKQPDWIREQINDKIRAYKQKINEKKNTVTTEEMMENYIQYFIRNKNSLNARQMQLLVQYLLIERAEDQRYIEILERQAKRQMEEER